MLSVSQAEGNNKCKEEMYNRSRMYSGKRLPPTSQCIPSGAKTFLFVWSSLGNLSLFEITRDSVLFCRNF